MKSQGDILMHVNKYNCGALTSLLQKTFGSGEFDLLPHIKQHKAINKYNSIVKYVRQLIQRSVLSTDSTQHETHSDEP